MKKLQCTKCQQIFWTELDQAYEAQIGSGEWMKTPSPKCGAEWAFVEPKTRSEKREPPKPRIASRKGLPFSPETVSVLMRKESFLIGGSKLLPRLSKNHKQGFWGTLTN